MLWYSLEAPLPLRGASNEYLQHMFSWRNKKNIITTRFKNNLIWNYVHINTLNLQAGEKVSGCA